MKAENQTETMIHLFLSEREALWLRAYLQNYCWQGAPWKEEAPEDYDMRKAFFDTLTSKLPNMKAHGRETAGKDT